MGVKSPWIEITGYKMNDSSPGLKSRVVKIYRCFPNSSPGLKSGATKWPEPNGSNRSKSMDDDNLKMDHKIINQWMMPIGRRFQTFQINAATPRIKITWLQDGPNLTVLIVPDQ
jgi:hypothetical protein